MSGYWKTMVASAFDYDRAAPLDRDTARVAARELAARGLTPHDISQALSLSIGAVLDLLGEEVRRG